MRATSRSAGLSRRTGWHGGDDGMEPETADMDVNRREWTQCAHGRRLEADLLVCFAQGGLFERLSQFDDAAGQGDLPPMPLESAGANSQDDMWAVLGRKERQEPGSRANPCVVEL